ncbi:hypothetical protein ZWY2020_037862 [Hordeum vulgare]|nr:hypothetical protein ZWY2020_037862 [Hordeum vulgare]
MCGVAYQRRRRCVWLRMARRRWKRQRSSKRKTREPKEENVTLGPAVREGEHVWELLISLHHSMTHSSTSLTCPGERPLFVSLAVKTDRDESSPYAAMLASQDVATRCKVCMGFHWTILCLEDVTPVPTDRHSTRRKGGRRGRRL